MPTKLTLLSRETPHDDVVIVHFERPMVDYIAGQYAFISHDGEHAKPYSIASHADENCLSFHFKKGLDETGLSHKLTDPALTAIYLHDIRGDMVVDHTQKTPLILCAGGVGIAPMKAILDHHKEILTDTPIYLFWGAADETQIYLSDWLNNIQTDYNALNIHLAVDRLHNATDKDIAKELHVGYVTDLITKVLGDQNLSDEKYYIAGPPAMAFATIETLKKMNIDDHQLYCDYVPRAA